MKEIIEEYTNKTHFITIKNADNDDFTNVKKSLQEQYDKVGFDKITVDNDITWQLKSSKNRETYVQVSKKREDLIIEVYNIDLKPIIDCVETINNKNENFGQEQEENNREIEEKLEFISKQVLKGFNALIKKENKVTVVDINMPFWSMVGFMVKWVIASIPAFIILFVLFAMFSGLLTTLLSTLAAN